MTSANLSELPQSIQSDGIWFGNYLFSEPEILPCAIPTCNSGLFAILLPDARCHPRSLRVLYFGESENIPTHLSPWHEKYWSWCERGGGAMNLRVVFLAMEGSSPDERRAALSNLIAQYQPELNTNS
ncbi:MAG TPA: hypothetical protein VEJ38_09300 [Candidatus Acidoferrales bacterium]|nr:hypothetical protein [Candidatus Acidoferrales bacterium]